MYHKQYVFFYTKTRLLSLFRVRIYNIIQYFYSLQHYAIWGPKETNIKTVVNSLREPWSKVQNVLKREMFKLSCVCQPFTYGQFATACALSGKLCGRQGQEQTIVNTVCIKFEYITKVGYFTNRLKAQSTYHYLYTNKRTNSTCGTHWSEWSLLKKTQ